MLLRRLLHSDETYTLLYIVAEDPEEESNIKKNIHSLVSRNRTQSIRL